MMLKRMHEWADRDEPLHPWEHTLIMIVFGILAAAMIYLCLTV